MASPLILTLTQENFAQQVLQSPSPVLVDFWAEWCGPCKMIAPLLDELADEYNGKVKIGKVNVDEHQELAAKYNVTAIPTLLFINEKGLAKLNIALAKGKHSYDKRETLKQKDMKREIDRARD